MAASKIQDYVGPVVGVYKKTLKGKHNKLDFVIDTTDYGLRGKIRLLGVSAIETFLLPLEFGTVVSIQYLRTETFLYQGEPRQKIIVEAKVL